MTVEGPVESSWNGDETILWLSVRFYLELGFLVLQGELSDGQFWDPPLGGPAVHSGDGWVTVGGWERHVDVALSIRIATAGDGARPDRDLPGFPVIERLHVADPTGGGGLTWVVPEGWVTLSAVAGETDTSDPDFPVASWRLDLVCWPGH